MSCNVMRIPNKRLFLTIRKLAGDLPDLVTTNLRKYFLTLETEFDRAGELNHSSL